MTKAASPEKQLALLHKKLAATMMAALDSSDKALMLLGEYPDLPERVKIFLEAACDVNPSLLQAVSKFLKDNDITCPQDESTEVDALATRLQKKRTVGNVTHLDED